jgi:hypothetical protein
LATPRFDPRDLALHHCQFGGGYSRISAGWRQERKMNPDLFGAQFKAMQLVDQREVRFTYRRL